MRASEMNLGAQAACGRVLWFLHADNQVPREAARSIIEAAQHAGCWGRFDVRLSGDGFLLRLVERLMNWRSRFTGIATGDFTDGVNGVREGVEAGWQGSLRS